MNSLILNTRDEVSAAPSGAAGVKVLVGSATTGVGAGAASAFTGLLAFLAGVVVGFSVDLDALTILGIIYYYCGSFLSDLHVKYIYMLLYLHCIYAIK